MTIITKAENKQDIVKKMGVSYALVTCALTFKQNSMACRAIRNMAMNEYTSFFV